MTAQTKPARRFSGALMFLLNNKAMLLMLVVALFASLSTGGLFVRLQNIDNVTRQVSVLAIVAIGYTIVVAGGGLDLSVGETLSLCVVTYGTLVQTLPIYVDAGQRPRRGGMRGIQRLHDSPFQPPRLCADAFRRADFQGHCSHHHPG